MEAGFGPEQQRQWIEGLRLLRAGQGYAAHEVWEELWHELRRSEDGEAQRLGRLLRALIQLAAGLHLREQQRWSGAKAVFVRAAAGIGALRSLDGTPPRLLGLELAALQGSLARAAHEADLDPREDLGIGWCWPGAAELPEGLERGPSRG
jgi:hypothetical protein